MSGDQLLAWQRSARVRLVRAGALARRAIWRLDDVLRRRLYGGDPGVALRPVPEGWISFGPAEGPGTRNRPLNGRAPRAHSDRVGVLRSETGSGMPAAARVGAALGLRVVDAPPLAWASVLERAIAEEWPLVVLQLGAGRGSRYAPALLPHFVERGGEVLVALEPGADVAALASVLGHQVPAVRPARAGEGALHFSSREPDITSWFTGITVAPAAVPWCLESRPGAVALASIGDQVPEPVLAMRRMGAGAVFISATAGAPAGDLRDQLAPAHWPAVVPPLLLMRRLYGELAWHAPATFANLTIDDPALAGGRLGLDYPRLLGRAEEAGCHVTIATIPGELGAADPSVLRLLAGRRDRLSACYHGWAHRGYEFFLPEAEGLRYRPRALAGQERALERAAAAGRRLWHRTGFALDRVMVFPHGVGPAPTLGALGRHGFVASCNFDDRDPLGAAPPADPELGLRPADTAWADLPLLWRRGLDDPRFLIDIGLGRPLLSFGHRREIGPELERFAAYASRVDAVAPSARWCDLETVARHAYLVRRDPAAGWQVLMTAEEICLHNDGPLPRRYTIRRPGLSPAARLSTGRVEVQPGGARRVSVERSGASRLPAPSSGCRWDGAPSLSGSPCSPRRLIAGKEMEVHP